MVEGIGKEVEATDGTDFTDSENSKMEVLADGHCVKPNQGQSRLIKADQGGGERGSEFRVPSSGLAAEVLADGRANGRENEDEVLADGHQEDGGQREGEGEGESRSIKANQGSEMVEEIGSEVEATDGTDFTDSEFQVEGENGGNENSEMEDGQVLADGQLADGGGDDVGQSEDGDGGIDIQETALRLAASQVYQILMGFRMQKGLCDPKNFAAITKCLATLSKNALDMQKFKESVAEQRHQRQLELDKDKPGGLTPEAIKEITEALNLL